MIQILYRLLILAVCSHCSTVSCFSQLKSGEFFRLSVETGLSSNRVLDVIQDKEGFYWIATEDGLNRFDGSGIKIFRNIKSDTTSLSHNLCSYLLEGDDEDIWVATYQGISRYSKKTASFRRYTLNHPAVNSDVLNRISGMVKDRQGNIWITSLGLWKLNPRNNEFTAYSFEQEGTLFNAGLIHAGDLYLDEANNGLWFLTNGGLAFFDFTTERFFHKMNNPGKWLVFDHDDPETHFVADDDGNKFFYSERDSRLFRFRNNNDKYLSKKVTFYNKEMRLSACDDGQVVFRFELSPSVFYKWETGVKDTMPELRFTGASLYSSVINRVYTDRSDNKWLATPEGCYVVRCKCDLVKRYFPDDKKNRFPYVIWSVAQAKDNSLWLGTTTGLYRYETTTQNILAVRKDVFNRPIRSLYNAGDSVLWIGDDEGLLYLFDQKKNVIVNRLKMPSTAFFITPDRNKHFWIGTWYKGLFELNEKGKLLRSYSANDGLPYDGLLGSLYDGADELWIGLNGGKGFSKININTKKFESHVLKPGKDVAVVSNTINAIIKADADHLWLGTYGGGLYYYDLTTGSAVNYRQSDGLSGDYLNTLAFDKAGNLWISTSNGIDIIEAGTKKIINVVRHMFFEDNGYINNFLAAKNGTFYYTANNTVINIDPAMYPSLNCEAKLLIAGVKIGKKEVPGINDSSSVNLSYKNSFFSVEYSVQKISPLINTQYAHKLEGLDADWNYTGDRGYVNYTNLSPGKYTLLLNATNEYGKWSDNPLSFSIVVAPPFWKTWWFLIGSSLLVLSLTVFLVQYRIRMIRKNEQERLRLIVATQEMEQKNIGGELHDHLGVRLSALKYFMASLKKYISADDGAAKEAYLKTMTAIDESIDDIRYLLINLSPKTLNEYGYLVAVEELVNKLIGLHVVNIRLKQQGMEKRLSHEEEAGLYRVTQELINNTLKHAQASSIFVDIQKNDRQVRLSYSDDGKGFDIRKKSPGYGIENINTRVALLKGRIEWLAVTGKGMNVVITIPISHTRV